MGNPRRTPHADASPHALDPEQHFRLDCMTDPHEIQEPSAAQHGHHPRRRLQLIGVALALVLAAAASWTYWQARSRTEEGAARASTTASGPVSEFSASERGEPVQLSGITLTDENVDLTSLRGNVVVLNVWGSWCAPCRQEAPVLAQQAALLNGQGVQFLGIDVQDNRPAALAFERRYGISYASIEDTDGRALLALAEYVPARAVPVTLVLDTEGRVAGRVVGSIDASTLSGLIESARNGGQRPAGSGSATLTTAAS